MGSMLVRHFFSCMWQFISPAFRPSQCFDGFWFGLLPDAIRNWALGGESLGTNLAVTSSYTIKTRWLISTTVCSGSEPCFIPNRFLLGRHKN